MLISFQSTLEMHQLYTSRYSYPKFTAGCSHFISSLKMFIFYFILMLVQGLTFPVAELFLEDILEKTRYKIKSEYDNTHGNSRRRRQQYSRTDPLTEMFEVSKHIWMSKLFLPAKSFYVLTSFFACARLIREKPHSFF